jgi:hypothetical protein
MKGRREGGRFEGFCVIGFSRDLGMAKGRGRMRPNWAGRFSSIGGRAREARATANGEWFWFAA